MTEDPRDRAPASDSGSAAGETRLLSEREGRRTARSRIEPVPRALQTPLRRWLQRFLHHQLEGRIALRLGLELGTQDRVPGTVERSRLFATYPDLDDDLLLDAIDLALQWDEALDNQLGLPAQLTHDDEGEPLYRFGRLGELSDLGQLLDDGRSTYQVRVRLAAPPILAGRAEPTLQTRADQAIADAEGAASALLARAWTKVYGRDEDPDGAYHDAVRAVEALVCPLVLPDSTRATLSSVVGHLKSPAGPRDWELVLSKLNEGSIDPLVAMLDRLWQGNLSSRHGDVESSYREVTLPEARAGVQLAALLVQWFSDGALRRRPPTVSR